MTPMTRALVAAWALCLASLAQAASHGPDRMSDYFLWHPAANAQGWALFLPGTDGLRVLEDERHYFLTADKLNSVGWSVLLVDYKPSFKAAGTGPEGTAAEKIAWVAEQAVTWLRREHQQASTLPGVLIGWSLGAEGVFRIVNDETKAGDLGIGSAVVYYPSNQADQGLHNHVPLLILSGEADDVSRARDVEAFVRDRAPGSESVELKLYPGAHHGFDVASLTKKKILRLLPLIGPKATLQYNEAAAIDAEKQLVDFLTRHSVQPPR